MTHLLASAITFGAPDTCVAQQARPPLPDSVETLVSEAGLRLRVLLDSMMLGGSEVEIGELTFPGGARTGGGHRHHSHEIFYVLSGTLDHTVNGVTRRLEPGMLGSVRAGDEVAHSVVSTEPVRTLVVWVPGGELERMGRILKPVVEPAPTLALDQLRDRWTHGYDQGDLETLRGLYTDDAVRLPYDAPGQMGRDAVLEAYRRSFATRAFMPKITLIPDDIRMRSGEATERGRYREILTPKAGGPALVEEGKYVSTVRQGADGIWRFTLSIFDRDAPAHRMGPGS